MTDQKIESQPKKINNIVKIAVAVALLFLGSVGGYIGTLEDDPCLNAEVQVEIEDGTWFCGTQEEVDALIEEDYQARKDEDCTGKTIQYEMQIVDGDKKKKVYYCDNNQGYTQKKNDLLDKIKKNKAKDLNAQKASAAVEILMIAKNDPDFFTKAKDEIQKKYDNKTHAFQGEELDADLIEQRQLWVELAREKCSPNCPPVDNFNSFNEYVYTILNSN